MVLIWEHIILLGQECACRVDKVDARQVVFHGNLLCSNVLLDSDRVVCTTLECEVVSQDHALATMDHADSSNDVSRRHIFVKACKLTKSQERGTPVHKLSNALSGAILSSFLQLSFLDGRNFHR